MSCNCPASMTFRLDSDCASTFDYGTAKQPALGVREMQS
jgi:hypothetical protein